MILNANNISVYVSILQAIISILALTFAIRKLILFTRQVNEASRQIKKAKEWDQKEKTFDYIDQYSSVVDKIDGKLSKQLGLIATTRNDKQISEVINLISNETYRKDLFLLMAYFERLAVGVNTKYLSEDIAKQLLYRVVISAYENLYDYITIRRVETSTDVCSNFEKLALSWSKKDG